METTNGWSCELSCKWRRDSQTSGWSSPRTARGARSAPGDSTPADNTAGSPDGDGGGFSGTPQKKAKSDTSCSWRANGGARASAGRGGVLTCCMARWGSTMITASAISRSRRRRRRDSNHNPWREAPRRAEYSKRACSVRGGGGWRRGPRATAPALDPTKRLCLPPEFQAATLQTSRNRILLMPAQLSRPSNGPRLAMPTSGPLETAWKYALHKIERLRP